MLKKEAQFWESVVFLVDVLVIAGAWTFAYWLRFRLEWPVPVVHGDPGFEAYALPLLFVPFVWGVLFKSLRLYRPRRLDSRAREHLRVVQAASLATLAILGAGYMLYKFELSRVFLATFWLTSSLGLVLVRAGFREALRFARRRGHNLRRALIVGTGGPGPFVRERLRRHPELGFELAGFVSHDPAEVGGEVDGVPVVASLDDLVAAVRTHSVDHLFVSLSPEMYARVEGVLADLEREIVNVTLVSDLFQHAFPRGRVEEFEGMPIVTIYESPMIGWNRVVKRAFDVLVAGALLLLTGPLLALVAVEVRRSSGRPIFYFQERMGLDGRRFRLVKFRTMRPDAEKGAAVWSRRDDPRCTRIGAFLRRTSLDELPQLWNVLKGEMSLVGPRPERPVFVDQFRDAIPRYVLRHRVKAGLTGLAQVHGLRGATSVQERLRYDLLYIENWSLLLDLKILWRTLWGGFLDRNG